MRVWLVLAVLLPSVAWSAAPVLDEAPAVEGEWGYRPDHGTVTDVTPPAFSWRPQKGLADWTVECHRGDRLGEMVYQATDIRFNVHCPATPFAPGTYTWRYRGRDQQGQATGWSRARTFRVPADAAALPMPTREELLARLPKQHPRLFVRPEQLAEYRRQAAGPRAAEFKALVAACDKLVAKPPDTAEPRKYAPGMKSGSDEWRAIWWGNREYTIRALDSAARLAFTRLLGGKEEYGQLARRILLDCAKWDPKGSTGYRYNDEAGMPYNWGFSRTYTFVYDLLSEDERRQCRQVMAVRGQEMADHLCPRHLWNPYNSHSNRAWHKLGEIGIAFLDEIPAAADWVWFAVNVFHCSYPVWSDSDGGWHEGSAYWTSYLERFSFWADVMKVALGIDAFRKPFFAQAGYYPLYLMPPGITDGGFGDLCENRRPTSHLRLASTLAAQAGNGHWQWYVDQLGGPPSEGGYIGWVRGARPAAAAKVPTDLPTSRLFRGIGQAVLNSSLTDLANGTQVVFKSSPYGAQSHGYEAQNSFLIWGYGQRLLIRTGRRDSYGSEHHRGWMWSTRSVNNLTVDGIGQQPHAAQSRGRISAFATTPSLDLVSGEAAGAYREAASKADRERGVAWTSVLDRYTRTILFAKPELIVVFDRLEAKRPVTFEYWLHALERITGDDPAALRVSAGEARCEVAFLAPQGLKLTQTDQYDPNPRARVKVREWHLTARTADKVAKTAFVALYRPHRAKDAVPAEAELQPLPGGYALRAKLTDGELVALLPTDDQQALSALGLTAKGRVVAERRCADGKPADRVVAAAPTG